MKRPRSSLSSEGLIAQERISVTPISTPGEEKGVNVGGGGSVEGLMIVMEQQQQQQQRQRQQQQQVDVEEEEAAAEEEEEEEEGEEEEDQVVVGAGVVNSKVNMGGGVAKKRRLGTEQVRALERSFEEENKLGPERKAQLARDLGLQPRQVAVWFQNRRARWKAKQLDRDFAALRSRHDALRLQCDTLRRDKDALAAEIKELKGRLGNSEMVVKLEKSEAADDRPLAAIAKDVGTSDSDSSVVFNEGTSPYSVAASDPQCFSLEFSSYFASSSSHPPPFFDNKSQLHKTFLEEVLLDDGELHNLSWYCTGEWD